MLAWIHRIHGLRYASLRYFNVAGAIPGRGEAHEPESHLIPLILDVALGRRESIKIFGQDYPTSDGTAVRDYIHVQDLAEAHLLAFEALDKRDRMIYNLGNGQGFTVRQVVESARRVTGHPIPVEELPRRAGDPAVLIASSAKIEAELGWKPKYTQLDDILAQRLAMASGALPTQSASNECFSKKAASSWCYPGPRIKVMKNASFSNRFSDVGDAASSPLSSRSKQQRSRRRFCSRTFRADVPARFSISMLVTDAQG